MLIKTILITCIFVAIAFILMGLRVFFTKNGRFPDTHIGGNEALRKKGITCAKTQDREARQ